MNQKYLTMRLPCDNLLHLLHRTVKEAIRKNNLKSVSIRFQNGKLIRPRNVHFTHSVSALIKSVCSHSLSLSLFQPSHHIPEVMGRLKFIKCVFAERQWSAPYTQRKKRKHINIVYTSHMWGTPLGGDQRRVTSEMRVYICDGVYVEPSNPPNIKLFSSSCKAYNPPITVYDGAPAPATPPQSPQITRRRRSVYPWPNTHTQMYTATTMRV